MLAADRDPAADRAAIPEPTIHAAGPDAHDAIAAALRAPARRDPAPTAAAVPGLIHLADTSLPAHAAGLLSRGVADDDAAPMLGYNVAVASPGLEATR